MCDFASERSDMKSRRPKDTHLGIRDGNVAEVRGMFSGLLPCRPKDFSASSVVGQLVGQSPPRFHSEVKSRTHVRSFSFSFQRHAPRAARVQCAQGRASNHFLSAPRAEGGAGTARTGPDVERLPFSATLLPFSATRRGGAGTARTGPDTPCTPAYRWARSRGRCFGDPVCAARRDGPCHRAQT